MDADLRGDDRLSTDLSAVSTTGVGSVHRTARVVHSTRSACAAPGAGGNCFSPVHWRGQGSAFGWEECMHQDSRISRRRMLQGTGAIAAGLALEACTSGPES